MENNYYVYEWIRLDTKEPFYVGKGSGKRWCELKRDNRHFNFIVEKIPTVVNILQENLAEKEAFEYEIWYIGYYRDFVGYNLVNIQEGGDNPPRLKGEANGNYGNHWSDDQKKKASERAKLSGRYAGINNPRATKIMCVETGKIYLQIKEASNDIGIKNPSSISLSLKTKSRMAYGLHWCKIDSQNEDYMSIPHNRFLYLADAYSESSNGYVLICLEDERLFQTRKEFVKFTKAPYRTIQQYFKNHQTIIHDNKEYVFARDYGRLI